MELWLFILGCLAGGFVLQTLLLRWTRNGRRPLRWVVPLPAAVLLFMAWREISTPHMFIGLSGLAALFYVVLAACILVGWGAGWGVYALRRRRETREEKGR